MQNHLDRNSLQDAPESRDLATALPTPPPLKRRPWSRGEPITVGIRIGDLTALEESAPGARGQRRWIWRCTCGRTQAVRVANVRSMARAGHAECRTCWWRRRAAAASMAEIVASMID